MLHDFSREPVPLACLLVKESNPALLVVLTLLGEISARLRAQALVYARCDLRQHLMGTARVMLRRLLLRHEFEQLRRERRLEGLDLCDAAAGHATTRISCGATKGFARLNDELQRDALARVMHAEVLQPP